MDLGLRDRVCVVTGSTGGIGLATARLLVQEGARVVTCGRSGAPGIGETRDVTDRQWDEMWQLNVMSYVRAIRAVLPGMCERGGGRSSSRSAATSRPTAD